MLASFSAIPVIGVPIKSEMSIEGVDSLLSIVQMPKGIPVATVGINNAYNAGVLALTILGSFSEYHRNKIYELKKNQIKKVESMTINLD
jgi:5-(carboxyamino)imidazole ribonucleotide mutase